MHLTINPSGELSLYRQIVRQIKDSIASGRLAPGEKLPSHRELSEQLVIAPLTVKKAYDELESEGCIETRRGLGTFVAERPPAVDSGRRADDLRAEARALLAQAYIAGFTLADVRRILRDADHELTSVSPEKEKPRT